MKRFHFGGDDEEEENEEERNDQIGPEFFSMAHIPLDSTNSLLDSAIKICEKSFFWKFYKLQTKLNKIKDAYNFLKDLELENLEGNEF